MGIKESKKLEVEAASSRIGSARAVVLADYRGLNVAQMTELRRRLRAAKVEFKVIKNTFLARAFEQQGIAGMGQYLVGPTVVAFGYDEPTVPARLLAQFARDNKELRFKAGVIEGRVATADLLQTLADLPSRNELLARVLGALRAPLSAMAGALAAPMRNMAQALAALDRKRGAGAAA